MPGNRLPRVCNVESSKGTLLRYLGTWILAHSGTCKQWPRPQPAPSSWSCSPILALMLYAIHYMTLSPHKTKTLRHCPRPLRGFRSPIVRTRSEKLAPYLPCIALRSNHLRTGMLRPSQRENGSLSAYEDDCESLKVRV